MWEQMYVYALHLHQMCWCSVAQPIISNLLFFSFPLENVSHIYTINTHTQTHRHAKAIPK